MRLRQPKTNGVYVEFRDRKRTRKSECLTIEEITPKQARSLIVRAIREHQRDQRKAG